ncbi:MAG: trxA 2 [Planctomycetota bacterium]|nr:trxA 2 [Planctomycetota bacterium]
MMFAPMLFALLVASPAAERTDTPTILDFTSTHCGPCQQMRPALEQLVKNGYPIKPVDIDKSPRMAEKYRITGVPTFLVVDADGRELNRLTGYCPASDIATLYRKAQAKLESTQNTVLPAEETEDDESDNSGEESAETARKNPNPWATVVRIKIDNPHSHSVEFGSGTIIRSTPDETIILTCAHIFKIQEARRQYPPNKFPLKIEVHLSDGMLRKQSSGDARTGYRAGVHMVDRYPGEAMDYDFTGDVGLIRIRPGKRLPATPVVPASWTPKPKMRMTTVGCSSGQDATAWSTWITNPFVGSVDGFANYEAIECAYAPKQGRSGGGLYTQDGMLAGVCDFAEPKGGHGLYATPRTIYKLLDRNSLTVCYAPDSGRSRTKAGTLVADNRTPGRQPARTNVADTLRTQNPDPEPRPKKLTIPRPGDLGVAPIATADEESERPSRSSDGSRRKPAWSNGGTSTVSGHEKPLRNDVDTPRVRVALGSADRNRKLRDDDEARPQPAELSMPPSVDRDPFEGIDTPREERSRNESPTVAKPRAGKAWQPARTRTAPDPGAR